MDLNVIPFLVAVYYLEKIDRRAGGPHHTQVRPALRRCFETPLWDPPTTFAHQVRTVHAVLHEISVHEAGSLPEMFSMLVLMRYSLDVLRSVRGHDSLIERSSLGATLLNRSIEIGVASADRVAAHPIEREILRRLTNACNDVRELYSCMFVAAHQQTRARECMRAYEQELMEATCRPDRVQWWMDHDEYNEIFLNRRG